MRSISTVFFTLAIPFAVAGQRDPNLQRLRTFALEHIPRGYDSTLPFLQFTPDGNLNYLYPLYQMFKQPGKFASLFGRAYDDQFSEAISFTEDYHSALEFEASGYEPVDVDADKVIQKNIGELKGIRHVGARQYITYLAKQFRIVMLNEAPMKALHRAFAISLLQPLYDKGYRYFALEMLSNFSNHSLQALTEASGHYTAEPVAGEMIRTALRIGFTLVSYEDTAALLGLHDARARDSVQAQNIYQIMRHDSAARIFVYATYGHIAEKTAGSDFIPMAMQFKKISGVDPLTIDQTEMCEGSNFGLGDALYKAYTQKNVITEPVIATLNSEPVNITNNDQYDLQVIHAPSVYRDGRPRWLALGGLRQPVYIHPNAKDVFLVQAYYQTEADHFGPGQIVPADQSYIPANNGNYLLYLARGKYTIIYRSMGYHLIGKLSIDVE